MPVRHPRGADPSLEPGAHPGGGSGAGVRLGWMVGCPLIMLLAVFTIASHPKWTFGASDVALLLGCVLAVGFRYKDIKTFHGQTANGQPATMADFRRYLVGLSTIVFACWIAAQSVHL